MTVHFNVAFWGSSPSMTCSLCKWECKAIDIKSILIQDCVGFFPLFLTGIYQGVMTWQPEADELPNAGPWSLKGGFEPLLCCVLNSRLRLSALCSWLLSKLATAVISNTWGHWSKFHSWFTQKFLEQLLGFSMCLSSVNLAQFNFFIILGESEGREKYRFGWLGFLVMFFK